MDNKTNRDAFIEQKYREMYLPLLQYATRLLRQPSLAEEAVQETFRIACAKPEAFCDSPNPNGWLIKTLSNVIRNTQRNLARLHRLVTASLEYDVQSGLEAPPDDHLDAEYGDLLSREDYALLKLVVLQRYSMKEAAEEYGISVEACKKRVQRAKSRLQNLLEKIENDPSPEQGEGHRESEGTQDA